MRHEWKAQSDMTALIRRVQLALRRCYCQQVARSIRATFRQVHSHTRTVCDIQHSMLKVILRYCVGCACALDTCSMRRSVLRRRPAPEHAYTLRNAHTVLRTPFAATSTVAAVDQRCPCALKGRGAACVNSGHRALSSALRAAARCPAFAPAPCRVFLSRCRKIAFFHLSLVSTCECRACMRCALAVHVSIWLMHGQPAAFSTQLSQAAKASS
jgi:hypothetical protein